MAFKELFSKYKVYTIISIIAILLLVAGGVTAGLLVGKQENQQLSIPVLAADFIDTNGLEYTILSSTDLTVSVSGYSGTSTTVVIPETVSNGTTTYTVTTIAGGNSSKGAFANKTTLTSITIPSSITTMQRYAFYNCTALIEINFNATNMADLDIYNYVFSYAGQDGEGITVNIGANVTTIPAYLFYPYSSSYSPKITTVNFAPNSQCTSIGSSAFEYCSGLTSITIPEGVTSIGESAFYNCSSLTSITIPNSVTSIGSSAFNRCSGLTSITIPNSVTSIGDYTFYSCSGLTSVTIPSSVTSIGYDAFSGCSGLTSITIPEGVTSIGEGAFSGCSGLTSITIPSSVTSIGERAFSYCSGLTSITIPEGVTSIGDYTFSSCSGLTSITISNSVTSIGYQAFNGCSGLTSITIPSSVTSIGSVAFQSCRGLTSITIPNSVTSIGYSAFEYCSGLTDVYYSGDINDWVSIDFGDENASPLSNATANFYLEGQTSTPYVFPSHLDLSDAIKIGLYSLYNQTGITSVTIGNQVTSIGRYAFSGCSGLTSVYYSGDINDWVSIDFGNEYASPLSNATANFYLEGQTSTPYVFPSHLDLSDAIKIGSYSLCNQTRITSVTIGNQVSSIGDYAFSGCSGLTSITIPEGVTSIGSHAFDDCSGLTEINFNVTNIADLSSGSYVFRNAGKEGTGITVNIGANVTRIPANLFRLYNSSYAPNIVTVNFAPNSQCTSIGYDAFRNCSSLTSVTIPEGVTSIGIYAFSGCSGLTEINFNATNMEVDSYNYIFDKAGIDGSGITVNIGANVTRIPAYLFNPSNKNSYAPNIVTVNFAPNSQCISIGESAFQYCSGLTDVYYSGDINDWVSIDFGNEYANPLYYADNFYLEGQTSTPYVFPSHLDLSDAIKIGSYSLYNQTGITSVTIGNQVTSIGESAFYNCSGLTSITIPEGVTSIGSSAFQNCSGLTDVNFQTSSAINLNIGNQAFYGNNSNVTYYVYNSKTLSTLQRIYSADRNTFTNDNFVLRSVVVLEFNNDLGYIDTDIVSGEVINGGVKELKAIIYYGSAFLYWEIEREIDGETVITRETTNPLTVTVEGTMTIRAVFSQELTSGVALMIKLQGDTTDLPLAAIGEVRITGYSNLDGVESIRVQAMASKGYEFVGWEVDGEMLADYQGEEHRTTNLPKDLVQGKIVYAVFKVKEIIN